MNEIKIFESPEFGKVRAGEVNGEPWFVAKDVAEALGYGNSNNKSKSLANAIVDHVDKEDQMMLDYASCKELLSRYQNGDPKFWINSNGMKFINESGLYSLIMSSKLPTAKKFKRWVTSEVLPSIRKHGAYMNDEVLKRAISEPDFLIKLATELKKEKEKAGRLETEVKIRDQLIGELKPKADYTDTILDSKSIISVTQIAKDYGYSGQAFNQLLHNLKVQYWCDGQWLLYAKYHHKGYTHSQTYNIVKPGGKEVLTEMLTKWTQKGRLFLYDLLKEHGIVPLIEQTEEEAEAAE